MFNPPEGAEMIGPQSFKQDTSVPENLKYEANVSNVCRGVCGVVFGFSRVCTYRE